MSDTYLVVITDDSVTKIAVCESENIIYQCDIIHDNDAVTVDMAMIEQMAVRRNAVLSQLKNDGVNLADIRYVIAEGGLLNPCVSGIYSINKPLVEDLLDGMNGVDVVNLGGLVAFGVANILGVKSFVVDPASIDERSDVARFVSHSALRKKSLFHAMIHKYLGYLYSLSIHSDYKKLNLVICHVDDKTVSVAAHKEGVVVDVNQAYLGYGAFGLQQSGTVPASNILSMVYFKHHTEQEIKDLLLHSGSFQYYLGTSSVDKISAMLRDGNKKARQIVDACAYQISKEIASCLIPLDGKIDAVLLSGKIFSVNRFFKYISKRIENMAPISVYVEDFRLKALIFNMMKYLNGDLKAIEYV